MLERFSDQITARVPAGVRCLIVALWLQVARRHRSLLQRESRSLRRDQSVKHFFVFLEKYGRVLVEVMLLPESLSVVVKSKKFSQRGDCSVQASRFHHLVSQLLDPVRQHCSLSLICVL